MSHFAKVILGRVEDVIVAEQEFIDSLPAQANTNWVQCSYNTYKGQHLQGGTPLRKNYPGKGWIYNSVMDAFYAPQPYPSWTLNPTTCHWEPPVAHPSDDRKYYWEETTLEWILNE